MFGRLALAALAVVALAGPLCAQGKKYALLVGVTEYDSATFTPLKYAENDAVKLGEVLTKAGYDDVVLLTTSAGKKEARSAPTAANVRAALDKLSNKVKRGDLLLVALSGHGALWPVLDPSTKKEKDESFFCPQDARPRSGKTLDELKKTMIPLGELFRTLDESGAGVRLMLVDACRNEVKGEARNIDFDLLPRTKKGTAILFSCKAGERAFESEKLKHGVFFHHVIDALKSKKNLTWSQLADHVADKVTEDVPELIGKGAKQTPHEMKNLEGRSPLLLPSPRTKGELNLAKEAADARVLYDLAEKYYYGTGVDKDEKKAIELYQKAGDKGHVEAMFSLGYVYSHGKGAEKDKKKAAEWYQKAADKAHVKATYNLALLYWNGEGVKKDDKKAAALYQKSADAGHVFSMYNLALLYEHGNGVPKDLAEALKWYKKAADLGDEDAKKKVKELEDKK